MNQRILLPVIFWCLFTTANGQYFQKEKRLADQVEKATSESDKIKALGELAEFYYIYKDDKKGDSVLQKQLLLSEVSHDNELIRSALFNNGIINLNDWSSIETFEKALAFLDKGLQYGMETGNEEYQAAAHLRKAAVYRKRGQYDQALQQVTLALSNIRRVKNDSLSIAVYLELGDVFLAKGDAVPAFKNYNTAYDMAYSKKHVQLLSDTYHHFADLYQSLSNKELKKQSLLKSLELNKKANNEYGLLKDYIGLARLTDEKEYFDKVIFLADKLNIERYKLYGKQLMFAYLMAVKKSSAEALQYLDANQDLRQSYINTGKGSYYWMIGNVYRYSNNIDSALHYYSLAEPEIEQLYDMSIRKAAYKGMADCYEKSLNKEKAVQYYEKAYTLSRQQNDYASLSSISSSLSGLYAQTGNFKKAYDLSKLYVHYQDTLDKMAVQRDVVMLEVERENKQHEQDLADSEAHKLKVRNLQYVGISIAVATILLLLVLSGMFPVSRTTVKMVGFVAFICLFEFITLLIDTWLHDLTHGEPLKIWLCKIVIIALLLPFHHYIEHAAVTFLASRRLMKIKEKISIKRILPKKKAVPALAEAATETNEA
jgi:tetratricopeptide (TPR) repeat protein